ncbi:MAG: hypothetical protein NTY01_07225 [Verrucomicrobia bacterium]|nr:hypothetical protein [Verrucomicrobiota bacterium]
MSKQHKCPSPEEIKALIGKRKIYIFAVNVEGVGFARRLTRMGFDVGGFIDSRKFKHDTKRGKPIIPPEKFFHRNDPNVFVVITVKHRKTRKWAIELCEHFGLVRNKTYMTTTDLCDYMPTIEVAGICNLRCISCNMGLPGANKQGGLMSAATYRKVLEKMSEEIPFLNSVSLYLWGEPLLNPELPEIIGITSELGVASEISTNLTDVRHIERVVMADPDVIVVPCSGIGENFGLTRTGGAWDAFSANLHTLSECIERHGKETAVRITYHIYKHNLGKDYDEVESLARKLGFQFFPILAHIFPERVLRHVMFGEPIPQQMMQANKLLYYQVDEQLEYAQKNKDKICFMMKAFPTVRWNRSVVLCCNLMEPVLSQDYLETPLEELLVRRERNGLCSICMGHGLHRFFDASVSVKTEDGKRVIMRG